MEEQWTNKMRQKMEGHEEPVPQGLWDDIERTMGQQKPTPVPTRKRYVMWATGLSAAAAAIVAIALLFGNGSPHPLSPELPQQPALAMQQPQQPSPLSTGTDATTKAEDFGNDNFKKEANSDLADCMPQRVAATVDKISPEMANAIVAENETEVQQLTQHEKVSTKTSQPARKQNSVVKDGERQSLRNTPLYTPQTEKQYKRRKRFSTDIYAANLPHSSESLNDYSELVLGNTLPQDFSTPHLGDKAPVRDIIYSNIGRKIKTHKKHRLPIKFGLSFRYHFNDRLSMESGLTYSYLSAELTAGSNDHHYRSEQRLHYLGIPLNINYDFWHNKRWNCYASAGGSIEKCVHGQLETDYVLNNRWTSSDRENIMEKPVQFSVNGAVGAQFNITPRFGLYAEPGVVYYFDNGSPIETIYKDKPFNFNFKLGLRLTFK